MTGRNRILVVACKPSIAHAVLPPLAARLPDHDLFVYHLLKIGPYGFNLPRGLAWSDYPSVSSPAYTLKAQYPARHPLRFPAWNRATSGFACPPSGVVPEDLSPERFRVVLREFDGIILASDAWHADVGAFAILMRGSGLTGPWPWMRLVSRCADSLAQSADEAVAALLGQPGGRYIGCGHPVVRNADVRRYFDWNWTVNSLAVLGRTTDAAGVWCGDGGRPFLSKYAPLLLHALARAERPMSEGEITVAMQGWKGTGRYAEDGPDMAAEGSLPTFGTPSSRPALIERLRSCGLLEEVRDGSRALAVGAAGWRLLSLMHPGTYDPDLPFRLQKWAGEGLDAAQPAMDRYIRTVFGRQKRFLGERSSRVGT